MFSTALEASESALKLDEEDHKAWYRKVQALKGLGKFKEAEEALVRLEDVAQWCPDRRRILRDCEGERKRLKWASAKHKLGTREMLGKALESGIFSNDREKELEDAAINAELPEKSQVPAFAPPQRQAQLAADKPRRAIAPTPVPAAPQKPLERSIHLTAALAGDLIDELAEAYSKKWFQEKVHKCARDSGYERSIFLLRLKDIAFDVQKPILEKWGFDGTEHGVREMTAAIREHAKSDGKGMPEWLKKKHDRCLHQLYGGKESGMLEVLST
eukprot:gnl/TRDRNA2_/TRDRNA2_83148_c0_seq2.p1 gnl/TRDRNA2_/TRDRNA2_83148_c0~~gnl/TRDRNA2_/TRDRNA2_83148_c0_seq2.p1  ORF type:complete len:272 (+),score=70.73 gnl/TRDRNA2_/TRDRNA2_83148_c0_seq2:104-919(+)